MAAHFAPKTTAPNPVEPYLQGIADRMARAEHLPAGMTIHVHYVDDNTVNAFATLGGHIVFFRGLLERLPNEDALAMVMAHEIAHVRNRDPISSLGRGMVIAIALSLIDNAAGTALAGDLFGQAGLLTQLSYSRAQEDEADRSALAALASSYHGVHGADDLFHIIEHAGHGTGGHVSVIYRSHPDISARLAALHRQAHEHGWQTGTSTPLPKDYKSWLKRTGKTPASCTTAKTG